MREVSVTHYKRGAIYVLSTHDSKLIEVYHTTYNREFGEDRVIEVSTWSGCPCRCRFCMTGTLNDCRSLSCNEILDQVFFVLRQSDNDFDCENVRRINYTRMGEPFLNPREVRRAIRYLQALMPRTRHYISTIGIRGSDFSWVTGNIALQISLHTLDEVNRNKLMPFSGKMRIKDLGNIRTPDAYQKPTLNLITDFWRQEYIQDLKDNFDPNEFFVKFTPLNKNQRTKEIPDGHVITSA